MPKLCYNDLVGLNSSPDEEICLNPPNQTECTLAILSRNSTNHIVPLFMQGTSALMAALLHCLLGVVVFKVHCFSNNSHPSLQLAAVAIV
jgi:hypothetical protein